MDGAVHTYKARLVVKGFTQTYRVDYEETFSPIADIRAIRILISIAAFYDYEIWQMDVKTSFLNGHLSEEVYMVQPEGFVNPKLLNRVCKLKCSIYGLKQASRSKRLIGLCQSAYIEKILKRYFMEISKRETIPMQEKLKLSKSQGASTPAEKQRMLKLSKSQGTSTPVRCTRPDAVFAQNITSRFQQNPGVVDWKSTKQSIFATSSTNAEYIDAFDASKETVWIQKFIYGLRIVPTIEEPINMYCDNTGAISIAKDHGVTKGARHFRAKVHYLRETIEMGNVRIEKVDTNENLADPFTKALAFSKHFELTKKIGMIPASSLIKIPWALSRINQIIAWPCPKGNVSGARRFHCQYKCILLLQLPSESCWNMVVGSALFTLAENLFKMLKVKAVKGYSMSYMIESNVEVRAKPRTLEALQPIEVELVIGDYSALSNK
ncbi:retrotransposon protein, putative, ty1-copia subclass [Tanacetum coccineum]